MSDPADPMDPDQMAAEGLQAQLVRDCEAMAKRYGLSSIFVMVTWQGDKAGTRSACAKAGNYYASFGAMRHWFLREEEGEREFQRSMMRNRE